MPTTYRATLTNVGAALVADAIAQGTTLTWAKMALGDGNGSAVTVDPGRTSLINERYRAPLNDLGRDSANPNTIVGTLVVPPETGGWTIREFGIYDNASTPNLVAYGETPEIEKPASSAGTGINLRLRFKLVVSADANITLAPDSNEAYATIEYVKDNAVKSLSVSGRTITYTMGNGDTHTTTTQDTTYNDATQSVHGLMSVNDKKKLDGIEAQAEVNQNAFSNVKVGNVTVAADSKTDTLELVAGTGIRLTLDTKSNKMTIEFIQPSSIELSPPSTYSHGGYIDFHFQGSSADKTSRIIEDASGNININGVNLSSYTVTASGGFIGNLKGNVTGNVTGYVTGNVTGDCSGCATRAKYLLGKNQSHAIYLDWSATVSTYVGLIVDQVSLGGILTTQNFNKKAAPKVTSSSGLGQLVSWIDQETYTLPSGGTWLVTADSHTSDHEKCHLAWQGFYSGGTTLRGWSETSGWAWRIA